MKRKIFLNKQNNNQIQQPQYTIVQIGNKIISNRVLSNDETNFIKQHRLQGQVCNYIQSIDKNPNKYEYFKDYYNQLKIQCEQDNQQDKGLYIIQRGIVPQVEDINNYNEIYEYILLTNISIPLTASKDFYTNLVNYIKNEFNNYPQHINNIGQNVYMNIAQCRCMSHDLAKQLADRISNGTEIFDSSNQDSKGNTVAMYLAKYKYDIDDIFYHDPIITNNNGFTVGEILAQAKQQPPIWWITPYNIENIYNQLLQYRQKSNIPWYIRYYQLFSYMLDFVNNDYDILQKALTNNNFNTFTKYDLMTPEQKKQYKHDTNRDNTIAFTFLMYLAYNNKIISREKQDKNNQPIYKLYLIDQNGNILYEIPKEIKHDPSFKNNCDGATVGMILYMYGVHDIPSEYKTTGNKKQSFNQFIQSYNDKMKNIDIQVEQQ